MKKIFIFLFISLVFFGSAFSLVAVNAEPLSSVQGEIAEQLQAAAGEKGAGYGDAQDPRLTAANIIRTVLEFLGTLFLVLTIYAGFLWMTAGGNEEKVTKAKSLLFQAVIGLVIILSAYSITLMVVKISLGKWTDYQNSYYIDNHPLKCGIEYGTACPPELH